MSIISLSLEDCPHLSKLHQAAFYQGWTEESFENFIKDPLVFGLKIQKDDALCGYLLWREIRDEAEILTLVISPHVQRQGLGNCLLIALIEKLRSKGITKLFLEVAEDNYNAQSFYIKNSFCCLGKRPNYYKRPFNEFVDALNFGREI